MHDVRRIWSGHADHLRLSVRLTPKGGKNVVEGLVEGPGGSALQVRVSEPPENGKANAALEKAIAKWLGLAPGTVNVDGGAKSRNKTVHIAGNPAELATRIEERLAKLA